MTNNNNWSYNQACKNLNIQQVEFDLDFIASTKQGKDGVFNPTMKMFDSPVDRVMGYSMLDLQGKPIIAIKPNLTSIQTFRTQVHELGHIVGSHQKLLKNISFRLFVEAEIAAEGITYSMLTKFYPTATTDIEQVVKNVQFWHKVLDTRPFNIEEAAIGQMMISPHLLAMQASKIEVAGISE